MTSFKYREMQCPAFKAISVLSLRQVSLPLQIVPGIVISSLFPESVYKVSDAHLCRLPSAYSLFLACRFLVLSQHLKTCRDVSNVASGCNFIHWACSAQRISGPKTRRGRPGHSCYC